MRYQDLEIFNSNDTLVKSDIFFGLKSFNDNILVYGDSRLIFNKYYYLFYKINVTNNPDAFRYFSESPDKKEGLIFLIQLRLIILGLVLKIILLSYNLVEASNHGGLVRIIF